MSSSTPVTPSRDDLAAMYLDQLLYPPYPVQEDALLSWYSEEEGILVCAPTGTGKTLIAEAALFEALHTGTTAYYTTPLIALTEQKFAEIQEAAVRWGFSADDVGLLTGNRKVNPGAKILVVVAEILLNRLLHPEGFDFSNVSAVVMDEFHSFNDPERGIVWELSLALLPRNVRLMLLSATVGNAVDFVIWMRREHGRKIHLVQGSERKIPLEFHWVADEFLPDQLEEMQNGDGEMRRTPALVFCFNREECWILGEQLKGRNLLRAGQQKELAERLDAWTWKTGAGPKLKQLLMRGVGVHHAGLLPKYRRRVEVLFQERLLSVCLCTETLAAGINLPARSVVMSSLVKGPPGKKSIVDASSAHQIFGRAGRPQFDTQGHVYAVAHEDDVKMARWKKQYDQIPEDTKDPNLIRAKKQMKKKMPKKKFGDQYFTEEQFQKLIASPPAHLSSKGQLPWRLLGFLLQISPEVSKLQTFSRKRLLPQKMLEKVDERLADQLMTLASGGFVTLDPESPEPIIPVTRDWPIPQDLSVVESSVAAEVDEESIEEGFGSGVLEDDARSVDVAQHAVEDGSVQNSEPEAEPEKIGLFGALLQEAMKKEPEKTVVSSQATAAKKVAVPEVKKEIFLPKLATPTDRMAEMMNFRSCHPIYGAFLLDHLGLADRVERVQIFESVLEIASSIIPYVRVPSPSELPPGPLAFHRINPELMRRGLITQRELDPGSVEPEFDSFGKPIRVWPVPLGDRMRRLFDNEFPGVHDLRTRSVWVVGDLLDVGGDFNKFVTTRDLTKQEGVIFRHCLRMILLCEEFSQVCPVGIGEEEWKSELKWLSDFLIQSCREVDPESTDKALESLEATPDVIVN